MAKRKTKKKSTVKKKRPTKRSAPAQYRLVGREAAHYPCSDDMERVLEAGGMSQLEEDEYRAVVGRFVTVRKGELCDDVPKGVLNTWIDCGWAELVADDKGAHQEEADD